MKDTYHDFVSDYEVSQAGISKLKSDPRHSKVNQLWIDSGASQVMSGRMNTHYDHDNHGIQLAITFDSSYWTGRN